MPESPNMKASKVSDRGTEWFVVYQDGHMDRWIRADTDTPSTVDLEEVR